MAEFAVDGIVDAVRDDRLYPHAESDLVLEPGAVVNTSRPLQALALPGHGADQIGMFNSRLGYLLSADLAFDGLPSDPEYGTRPDPRHAHQLRSLQSAIALAPELLLPGHGMMSPRSRAPHRCRALVLERVDRVLDVIDASGFMAWDVAVWLDARGGAERLVSAQPGRGAVRAGAP